MSTTEDQAPSSEAAGVEVLGAPAVSGPGSPARGLAVPAMVPAPPETVGCTSCGSGPRPATLAAPPDQTPVPVVAVGAITSAFPSLSVEREFAQLHGQKEFKGFTDRQTMHSVLSQPESRYLARRMCFLLTPY